MDRTLATLLLFVVSTCWQLLPEKQTSPKPKSSDSVVNQKTAQSQAANADVTSNSHQVMFPARHGIAWGISVDRADFRRGDSISIDIWMDNQTDQMYHYQMCCAYSATKIIDVYEASHHRVRSHYEQDREENRKKAREEIPEVCTCSAEILVSPHSHKIVDRAFLDEQYTVGPGQYFITEKSESQQPVEKSDSDFPALAVQPSPPTQGITISISDK